MKKEVNMTTKKKLKRVKRKRSKVHAKKTTGTSKESDVGQERR